MPFIKTKTWVPQDNGWIHKYHTHIKIFMCSKCISSNSIAYISKCNICSNHLSLDKVYLYYPHLLNSLSSQFNSEDKFILKKLVKLSLFETYNSCILKNNIHYGISNIFNLSTSIILWWKCNIPSHPVYPLSILLKLRYYKKNSNGCMLCSKFTSKREKQFALLLIKHNIEFQHQRTFAGCFDTHLLRFDFYLPNYDTCVEIDDGNHHLHHLSKNFNSLNRDKIKNKFCKNNNLYLIRIKYNDDLMSFFIKKNN